MAAPSVVTTASEASRLSAPRHGDLPDLRVVALGGGTGLPTVLRGLRAGLFESYPWDPERDQTRLTAIATVADDGGSSGKLPRDLPASFPGDIRNCLLALADGDPALSDVFSFRFSGGSEVAVITKIETYIDKYVALSDSAYTLPLALWTMGTHIYNEFDAYPYLVITSLTKRSGKTRCSEVLSFLSANPRNFSAMSGAALYRVIEQEHPTIVFDEAETLSSEAASTQRSVLNVGYRKGQLIPRVGIRGAVENFDTYCPKMFVLIGDVYDTLKDRSIILPMRRQEPKERFLYTLAKNEGNAIAAELGRITRKNKAAILAQYQVHTGLDFLGDRDEEIWTPLFILAYMFCPDRMETLKHAAMDMATEKTADSKRYINLKDQEGKAVEEEYAQKLLIDLYGLFLDGSRVLSTVRALDGLRAIPVAPWRKFRGSGLSAHDLRNMLSRFGVKPVTVREPKAGKGEYGKVLRGYKKVDVERAVQSLK